MKEKFEKLFGSLLFNSFFIGLGLYNIFHGLVDMYIARQSDGGFGDLIFGLCLVGFSVWAIIMLAINLLEHHVIVTKDEK